MNVLMVCTGNTCRSPMAAGALKSLLFDRGITNIRVQSGGVGWAVGSRATDNAIKAAAASGVDISSHRSRSIGEEDLEWAVVVLTMTAFHWYAVTDMTDKDRVWTLTGFPDEAMGPDIDDPIGGSLEVYQQTYQEIERELIRLVPVLEEMAQARSSA